MQHRSGFAILLGESKFEYKNKSQELKFLQPSAILSSRPVQSDNFQANLNWCDGPFKYECARDAIYGIIADIQCMGTLMPAVAARCVYTCAKLVQGSVRLYAAGWNIN
jgi:hypothetical protein